MQALSSEKENKNMFCLEKYKANATLLILKTQKDFKFN